MYLRNSQYLNLSAQVLLRHVKHREDKILFWEIELTESVFLFKKKKRLLILGIHCVESAISLHLFRLFFREPFLMCSGFETGYIGIMSNLEKVKLWDLFSSDPSVNTRVFLALEAH